MSSSYKIIALYPKEAYGYILVRNNSPYMMETNIRLNNVKGLKPIKPDAFPFHLFVPANSHVVRPLIVDPEGYAY